MEDRTRLYLRGRFRDHYRRVSITPPPAAERREWAYIPWSSGPGTRMIRHRSLLDLGDLEAFLVRERPRHVFFSAGRFERPGAGTMEAKGWMGADLIFDLDADHLPGVQPGRESYGEMLAACKDALKKLLDFLLSDFGFEDLTVVFSGGRGYHVHVRDPAVQPLESDQRREIVDYVRGIGLDFEALISTEPVAGLGRRTPAEKRTLDTDGGWSRRVHAYIMSVVNDLLAASEEDAVARLQGYDGIGEAKASAILKAARTNYAAIERGNIDVHPAFFALARTLIGEAVAERNAPIDEPVTTDTNRLIRLPGSLHGGSGLSVMRLAIEDLDGFEPLVDAIPETFTGHDIAIDLAEDQTIALGGAERTLTAGEQRVPEFLGVHLMARGLAEKARE